MSFNTSIDLRKVNPLTVALASCLLSILILYFGWTRFVSSQDETLAAKRQAVQALAAENEVNRVVEREEPMLKQEVERAKQAYCQVSPLVSKDSDVSQILADIQREAVKDEIALTGFQAFKDSAVSPQFDKLYQREYPATATGSYAGVRRFFQALARMDRIVVVPEFKMIAVSPRVSTGFTLVAYNAPPQVPQLPAAYGALACAPPEITSGSLKPDVPTEPAKNAESR